MGLIGVGIHSTQLRQRHAPEYLLPSVTMASRQKSPANDAQQPPGEEEAASGNGEGDEIMEEAEEQEDGYSQSFLSSDPYSSLVSISISVGHLCEGLD